LATSADQSSLITNEESGAITSRQVLLALAGLFVLNLLLRVFYLRYDFVNGDEGVRALTATRLLDGARLYAALEGACAGCAVRVRRPVLVSSAMAVQLDDGATALADVVRALEGRMETDERTGAVTIYAGACSWCVLEPAPGGG